jgi:hypothetical protein
MSMERPDHHDAELVLRVYELRREAVMREARAALNQKFQPRSFEDVLAVTKGDHPLNAAYRQVGSYWEMVYSFPRHGIVHPDFWMETNGEGLLLFAKVAPFLERVRQEISPVAFRHAAWVSRECAEGRRLFQVFSTRIRKALEAK